jgi:hypothetical protein
VVFRNVCPRGSGALGHGLRIHRWENTPPPPPLGTSRCTCHSPFLDAVASPLGRSRIGLSEPWERRLRTQVMFGTEPLYEQYFVRIGWVPVRITFFILFYGNENLECSEGQNRTRHYALNVHKVNYIRYRFTLCLKHVEVRNLLLARYVCLSIMIQLRSIVSNCPIFVKC